MPKDGIVKHSPSQKPISQHKESENKPPNLIFMLFIEPMQGGITTFLYGINQDFGGMRGNKLDALIGFQTR